MSVLKEGYKKTEGGVIPEDWEVGTINDILELRKESFNPILEKNKKCIGLEYIEEASGRLIGFGNSNETTSIKSRFYKGDILFGKLRPYLRKYYLAEFEGVCVTEMLTLMANKSNNRFCYYKIQEDKFLEDINNKTFGTKMPRTSWKEIRDYQICIPPVKEQVQIAQILSLIDYEIDEYENKKQKLEELKKRGNATVINWKYKSFNKSLKYKNNYILKERERIC